MSTKLTVITTKDGKLVGASYGHIRQPDHTTPPSADIGYRAGPMAGPDQKIHFIEVGDDLPDITAPKDFHARIESEIAKISR